MEFKRFRAYTPTSPAYKGGDALLFYKIRGRFYPFLFHSSAIGRMDPEHIEQKAAFGFFHINASFYNDFASGIVDKLNEGEEEKIYRILEETFEMSETHV